MAGTAKRMKGTGRVAFIANKERIAADLEAGWPVKAVYEKLSDTLGISYPQFARYVQALIRSAGQPAVPRPSARGASASAIVPMPVPTKPIAPTTEEGQPSDARHEPVPRPRTFVYDGNPKQDDKARLIGRRDPKP